MTKVDNNNGFELSVVSNDEKYKLRARRIMKKDGCAYDRNGKVIAGAPWCFCGWDAFRRLAHNGVHCQGRDGRGLLRGTCGSGNHCGSEGAGGAAD